MSREEGERVMDDTVAETGNVDVEASDVKQEEVNATNDVIENGETTDTKEEATPLELDFKTLKLPEGVSVSDAEGAKLLADVKEFGITTQEGLQKFTDWVFRMSAENDAVLAEQENKNKQEWEDIKSNWKETLQKDADFGKDYDANIKRANDAINRFGGSELNEWLDSSDLRDNPAIIKTFARIGKEFEDAKLLSGSPSIDAPRVKRDRYNQPMLTFKD
jgi:hypothetical protein